MDKSLNYDSLCVCAQHALSGAKDVCEELSPEEAKMVLGSTIAALSIIAAGVTEINGLDYNTVRNDFKLPPETGRAAEIRPLMARSIKELFESSHQ